MKYDFEQDLEQNLMSMQVIDARRFARAIRSAMRDLKREAGCYSLTKEPYYLDVQTFLEKMATRLEAKVYTEHEEAPEQHKGKWECPNCRLNLED